MSSNHIGLLAFLVPSTRGNCKGEEKKTEKEGKRDNLTPINFFAFPQSETTDDDPAPPNVSTLHYYYIAKHPLPATHQNIT